jgi:hypothetical protein
MLSEDAPCETKLKLQRGAEDEDIGIFEKRILRDGFASGKKRGCY